ncbi:g8442 [Coccomyxa viridis]|uniref:G8442 protein n=1 Tax=Coccomyxa viridis TaxID=1274662 RepID=A0ABP1G0D0_9CHLO
MSPTVLCKNVISRIVSQDYSGKLHHSNLRTLRAPPSHRQCTPWGVLSGERRWQGRRRSLTQLLRKRSKPLQGLHQRDP